MNTHLRSIALVLAALAAGAAPFAAAAQTQAMGASAQLQEPPLGSRNASPQPTVQPGASGSRFQPTGPMPIPAAPMAKDYRLSPNDLFDLEVFELENLKRTVRVNAAGMVSLPLIGSILVGGLTPQEAEELIARKYSEKYLQDPHVSIFVREFTTERITVEGAVGRPGIFPLTGQMTLLRVLALAGGFGPIANPSEVMIFRVNEHNVKQVAVFDVEQIRAGKSEDPPIRGDDLIVVQRDKTRALLKDSIFRDVMDSINPFSVFAR